MLPSCLKYADCGAHQTIITLEQGEANIPQLMLFNQYDVKAWEFYSHQYNLHHKYNNHV